jgi:hypothetical protein
LPEIAPGLGAGAPLLGAGRREEGERPAARVRGGKLRKEAGLGDRRFLGFFLPFVLKSEAFFAGVVAGKGVGHGRFEAEFRGAILDHGEPSIALNSKIRSFNDRQGGEEAEEPSEDAHGDGVAGGWGAVNARKGRFWTGRSR